MKIKDVAELKTGAVVSRLSAQSSGAYPYRIISLRDIDDEAGTLDSRACLTIYVEKVPSDDFLTRKEDILLRLSAPYTAVMIDKDSEIGLLIPSHFAIIRAEKVQASFLYAMLDGEDVRKQLLMAASVSTTLGTISVRSISECMIPELSLRTQELIGKYHLETKREFQLLRMLSEEKRRLGRIRYTQITEKIKTGELL